MFLSALGVIALDSRTLRTKPQSESLAPASADATALDAGPHEVVPDGDEPPAELGDRRRSTAFRFARERGAPAVRHGDGRRRQLRDPRRQEARHGGDELRRFALERHPRVARGRLGRGGRERPLGVCRRRVHGPELATATGLRRVARNIRHDVVALDERGVERDIAERLREPEHEHKRAARLDLARRVREGRQVVQLWEDGVNCRRRRSPATEAMSRSELTSASKRPRSAPLASRSVQPSSKSAPLTRVP